MNWMKTINGKMGKLLINVRLSKNKCKQYAVYNFHRYERNLEPKTVKECNTTICWR